MKCLNKTIYLKRGGNIILKFTIKSWGEWGHSTPFWVHMSRGVNFFPGQGGMKAGIDRHSRTFFTGFVLYLFKM